MGSTWESSWGRYIYGNSGVQWVAISAYRGVAAKSLCPQEPILHCCRYGRCAAGVSGTFSAVSPGEFIVSSAILALVSGC